MRVGGLGGRYGSRGDEVAMFKMIRRRGGGGGDGRCTLRERGYYDGQAYLSQTLINLKISSVRR